MGKSLILQNGGLAIDPNSGTPLGVGASFPSDPLAMQTFYRSDLGILFQRDSSNSAWDAIRIKENVTLNVKASPTGALDFASVYAAINFLNFAQIDKDVTVTINGESGSFSEATQIIHEHPQGDKIKLQGAPPITKSITSCDSVTGSVGDYSITYTLSDTTSLAVGQYAIIHTTGGGEYKHAMHQGFWEITAISSPQVTIKNTHRYAGKPPVNTDLTSGSFTVLSTILLFGTGGANSGLVIKNRAYIKDIGFVMASSTANGIFIDGGKLEIEGYVGVSKFDQNNFFVLNGGSVKGSGNLVCSSVGNNGNGLQVKNGIVSITGNLICSGNDSGGLGSGISGVLGSKIIASSIVSSGNSTGIGISDGGSLSTDTSLFCAANSANGVQVVRGGKTESS